MAGCKVPLPYSRGLPAAVQASATATPVTQHIRKHMARQLADIRSDAIWQRHLEQVRCHTEACTPADAATPQHTADNKGTASPVKLQPVDARQFGNATRCLSANFAITTVPSLASACIATKAGAVSNATGHPHQPVAVACCKIDTHHREARSQSQQQGTCVTRAASRLEPLAAPLQQLTSCLYTLHMQCPAPDKKLQKAAWAFCIATSMVRRTAQLAAIACKHQAQAAHHGTLAVKAHSHSSAMLA